MISKKWLLAAGTSAVLAFGVAACGDDSSSSSDDSGSSSGATNLSGEIAGAGASSQEAAQEAWIAGVQDANPDLTISYDPVGLGRRPRAVQRRRRRLRRDPTPRFADEELTAAEKNCGGAENFVQVPAYISPIAIVYNLPDVDDLQLDAATIAQIFDQKITTWNDPAIAQLNPDAEPARHSDHPGQPLRRLGYDEQLHPVPVEGGAPGLAVRARRRVPGEGRRVRRGHLGRGRGGRRRRGHDRLRGRQPGRRPRASPRSRSATPTSLRPRRARRRTSRSRRSRRRSAAIST